MPGARAVSCLCMIALHPLETQIFHHHLCNDSEIVLTWSLLTGKAQIFLDSKMIYRHEPIKDEVFVSTFGNTLCTYVRIIQ